MYNIQYFNESHFDTFPTNFKSFVGFINMGRVVVIGELKRANLPKQVAN